jgi:hypothetical protein
MIAKVPAAGSTTMVSTRAAEAIPPLVAMTATE